MSRIFLSHSSGDTAETIALRDWMAAQGWDDVFLDVDAERGLRPGDRWQAALKQAAGRCELVVVVISPAWAGSKWCLAEFLLATNLSKRIVAVIVAPTPFKDLPTELTAEWQVIDLSAGQLDVAHEVTWPPGTHSRTVAFSSEALGRLRIGLTASGLDPKYFAWPPPQDPRRAPYRGLMPLQAEDAGIFFGRDGPIVNGLDMLRGLREGPAPRLLVIIGASGSGKSSYMRAGLLPRLARQDRHFLTLPVLRPERACLTGEAGLIAGLEQAFQAAGLPVSRARLRAAVDSGADSLAPLLQRLVDARTPAAAGNATPPRPPLLVLPIDQGEELFTADGRDEAETLLRLIGGLSVQEQPGLIVLFTIRSDSYEPLQSAKPLEGLRQHTLSLAPMPRGAYIEVIKGPARQLTGTPRALMIDEPLVEALLADIDAGGAKDALPLLAFTLERLYLEHGGDGRLTLAAYESLGRVQGSIEAAVQRVWRAADRESTIPKDPQARLALLRRGLIPWLAGMDPDSASPRRSVARLSEIPVEARSLIELLVQERLLATDADRQTGEKTVEPAHEALLRQWGLLRGWLAEDAGLLAVLEGVRRAARDWSANRRDEAWLAHRTHRLDDADRLQKRADLATALEPTDLFYLQACRAHESATLRRAHTVRAALAGLALAVGLGGLLWWQQDALVEAWHWRVEMGASVLSAAQERVLAAQPGAAFSECARGCPTMVVVPAGHYPMGSDEPAWEAPVHEVTLARPFAVGRFEVTFDEWDACHRAGACDAADDAGWGRGRQPVINVGWHAVNRYLQWLARLTGRPYRLLTESEWEYAARAGPPVPTPQDAAALAAVAWFKPGAGGHPHPVGLLRPNAFGLHDVQGNVAEWLADNYDPSYQTAPVDGAPQLKGREAHRRLVRGGSWQSDAEGLRLTRRDAGTADLRTYPHVGFRVARSLQL